MRNRAVQRKTGYVIHQRHSFFQAVHVHKLLKYVCPPADVLNA